MKYFFMTAGSLPQRDYLWWHFIASGQPLINADRIDLPHIEPFSDLNEWLDGDPGNSSLILGRDNHVFLLLTDLPTTRQDYQRRTIRNSVIFVSENDADEKTIRHLAAAVIESIKSISDALNQALEENTESTATDWFSFDQHYWERNFLPNSAIFAQKLPFDNDINQFWRKLEFNIAGDTEEKKQEIRAYLLNNDISLPEESKIFVLVTKYKDPKFYFRNANKLGLVLTSLEKSDQWSGNPEPEFIKVIVHNIANFAVKSAKKIPKKILFNLAITFFIFAPFGYYFFSNFGFVAESQDNAPPAHSQVNADKKAEERATQESESAAINAQNNLAESQRAPDLISNLYQTPETYPQKNNALESVSTEIEFAESTAVQEINATAITAKDNLNFTSHNEIQSKNITKLNIGNALLVNIFIIDNFWNDFKRPDTVAQIVLRMEGKDYVELDYLLPNLEKGFFTNKKPPSIIEQITVSLTYGFEQNKFNGTIECPKDCRYVYGKVENIRVNQSTVDLFIKNEDTSYR